MATPAKKYSSKGYNQNATFENYRTFVTDGQPELLELLTALLQYREVPSAQVREEVLRYFSALNPFSVPSPSVLWIFLRSSPLWLETALSFRLDLNASENGIPVLYHYIHNEDDSDISKWKRVEICLHGGFEVVAMNEDMLTEILDSLEEFEDDESFRARENLKEFVKQLHPTQRNHHKNRGGETWSSSAWSRITGNISTTVLCFS